MPNLRGTFAWTILGGFLGLLLGGLGFVWIRARGGYRLEVKGAMWLRALVCLVIVVVGAGCGGVAGFHQGLLFSVQRISRDDKVCRDLLPQVGRAEALFLAGVYSAYPQVISGKGQFSEKQLQAECAAFAEGKWELDVNELDRRLMNTPTIAVNSALQYVDQDINLRCPEIRNQATGRVLFWFLNLLSTSVLSEGMNENDVAKAWKKILKGLPVEAAKQGNPHTISCSDLSAYLMRQSFDQLVVKLTRYAVRSNQLGALGILLLTLALSTGIFRFAESMRKRRSAGREEAAPAPPSEEETVEDAEHAE